MSGASRSRSRSTALAIAVALGAACSPGTPPALPGEASASRNGDAEDRLRAQLREVFGATIMSRGMWAVEIRSLDRGDTLFSLNAGRLAMPASNQKIVTMAAAAEILGWDYRFRTTLETAAPLEGGVMRGDLVVSSTGDPTINTRQGRGDAVFTQWTAALRAAGITRIEGRIVGDDQAFDDEWLGNGWSWDYLQFGYAAPVGALQFNENTARLRLAPATQAGDPALVELSPGCGLTVLNRTITAPAGAEPSVEFRRHLDKPVLEVSGTTPVGGQPLVRSVAVVNPTLFFAQSLKDALTAGGIPVSGEAADYDDILGEPQQGAERRVLVTTESPTLHEMGTVLMKVSQNLYAETFLKAIGAAQGGLGTTNGGRNAVRDLLTSWGVPRDAYIVSDGSGLSRNNYVSAGMIATILERMYRDAKHHDLFIATLPIAGKDGTISTRMRRSLAEGNAVAKTGSIANVRSLSGYVRARNGEMLVFSIIANDFPIPAATVTWIADLAVEVLAAFSR